MSDMQFNVYASSTVSIAGLQVQLPTLGKQHSFRFAGHECAVLLPATEKVSTFGQARREESLVDAPEDVEHTWYGVYEVEVFVYLPEPIESTEDESTFNTPEIANSEWGRNVRINVPPLIAGAFEYWLKTIRCTALSSSIRYSTDSYSSFVGGFRVYRTTDQKLYSGYGGTAYFQGSVKISVTEWDNIQELFDSGYKPVLWLDYLTDGMHRLHDDDLSGAIVSTVIACETVIRALFWQAVPEIANQAARQVIDNASIQTLLANIDKLTGVPKADWKAAGKSDLHKIFDARNALVHRGDTANLNKAAVSRLLNSAKNFVVKADSVYRTATLPGSDRDKMLP